MPVISLTFFKPLFFAGLASMSTDIDIAVCSMPGSKRCRAPVALMICEFVAVYIDSESQPRFSSSLKTSTEMISPGSRVSFALEEDSDEVFFSPFAETMVLRPPPSVTSVAFLAAVTYSDDLSKPAKIWALREGIRWDHDRSGQSGFPVLCRTPRSILSECARSISFCSASCAACV